MLAKSTLQKSTQQTISSDNSIQAIETLEKYTRDAINLYESLYGALDIKSQRPSPSPSEERSAKRDSFDLKPVPQQKNSQVARSQSGLRGQGATRKTYQAYTDSRRQSAVQIMPDKVQRVRLLPMMIVAKNCTLASRKIH